MGIPTDIQILTERDPAALERFASHRAWQVRAHVARNLSVSPEVLARLAADRCAAVRTAVAHNQHSAAASLVRLASDSDPEVREEALSHPTTEADILLRAVHSDDPPPVAVIARWVDRTRQRVPMELAVRCLDADDIVIRRIGIGALLRLGE